MLKAALKILYGGTTPEEIHAFLPLKLEAIGDIANNCQEEAASVVTYFQKVIDTLAELQRQTLLQQGKTQEAKETHEFKIKLEEEARQNAEVMNEKSKKDVEELKRQVEEAHKDWKDAVDSMPGAGELIGAVLVDTVCQTITAVGSAVSLRSASAKGSTADTAEVHSLANNPARDMPTDNVPKVLNREDQKLVNEAKNFKGILLHLDPFFETSGEEIRLSAAAIESGLEKLSAMQVFETMQKSLASVEKGKGNKTLKDNLIKIATEGIELVNAIKKQPKKKTDIVSLQARVQKLIANIDPICTEGNARMGISHFHRPGPGFQNTTPPTQSSGIARELSENAHRKVEMTRAELDSRRKASKEAEKEQLELQKDLQESMRQLESFKQVAATSGEILVIIQKGLEAFAQLKEQWTKLHQFFMSMSTLIRASLSPQINLFVKEAKEMAKIGSSSIAAKEIIYQTAFQSVKVAAVVHHLSDSYCSISKEHLMPLILQLDQLIALDKERDQDKIVLKKSSLGEEAKKAQKAIENIIKKKHRDFQVQSEERMKSIDAEMKLLALPAIPESRKAAIQEEAKKVVEKVQKGADFEALEDFC